MSIFVILCSCNGERYISRQIESILEQTEPGVRLLISDDCSTDRTAEIAEGFARLHPDRIQVFRRETPSGGAARHFLSTLSRVMRGRVADLPDYLLFSDQDDVWHPDKVQKTLNVMRREEHVSGTALPILVHCDMRVTDDAGNVISPSYVRYQQMSPERNHLNELLVQNNVTGGAMMMNRALARLIAAHPVPEHAVMHDQWIALAAAAFGRVVFFDKALYDYRQHGDNVLGAAKGSRVREVADRLGLFRRDKKTKADMDLHSRRVYDALFLQAGEFYLQYGRELSPRNREILTAFLALPKMGRPEKIRTILKYGFTFNRLHRTVGECLFL